jgi:diguanylate cyclase (GGDEF)-like protein
VGRTLTEVARDGDLVCRYAGDEFVLLLTTAGSEQAEQIASRVRDAIDGMPPAGGTFDAANSHIKVGASIGVATFPCDGLDARTLLHVADERMYEDKFQRRRHRSRSLR